VHAPPARHYGNGSYRAPRSGHGHSLKFRRR
jgi:hypothetical protein